MKVRKITFALGFHRTQTTNPVIIPGVGFSHMKRLVMLVVMHRGIMIKDSGFTNCVDDETH